MKEPESDHDRLAEDLVRLAAHAGAAPFAWLAAGTPPRTIAAMGLDAAPRPPPVRHVPDVEEEPDLRGHPWSRTIRAMAVVPVPGVEGGSLGMGWREPGVPAPARLDALQRAARLAAALLDGRRQRERVVALERRAALDAEERALLEEALDAIAAAGDPVGTLEALLRTTCRATGWVCGEAWIPDEDGALRSSGAWWSAAPEAEPLRSAAARLAEGDGLVGLAWTLREPVRVPDLPALATFRRGQEAALAGLRAAVAIPIGGGGPCRGVLVWFLRAWSPADDRFVRVAARVAAAVGPLLGDQRPRRPSSGSR